MEFQKNTLLFGADPTPRIVAVELGETALARLIRPFDDGNDEQPAALAARAATASMPVR